MKGSWSWSDKESHQGVRAAESVGEAEDNVWPNHGLHQSEL